jgi:hypothetical protein
VGEDDPMEEWSLIRRWAVYLVVIGFLAGLNLCLIPHFDDHHHGSGAPSTETHIAQACGTFAVVCEDQPDSNRLLLASALDTEQNPFYDGVSLRPPFPPPRG